MCREPMFMSLRASLRLALLLLVGVAACASDSEPSDTGSQEPDIRQSNKLTSDAATESACGANGRGSCPLGQCPLEGRRIDEARRCTRDAEPVGCAPAGTACPPAIVFGIDAQGVRWSFPSGCVPSGFSRLNDVGEAVGFQFCTAPVTPPPPCEARPTDDCGHDGMCKLASGIQYDPTRRCRWPGTTKLACVDFKDGCSTVITHASYAGELTPSFQFNDSCIPPKYVTHENAESVDDWQICAEAR